MVNNYRPLYHSDINETFIIEPEGNSGSTIISACTAVFTNSVISCSGDSQINLSTGVIEIDSNLEPNVDANLDLGSSVRRFRNISTVSGTSTVWTSTIKVTTPTLDLGIDSQGNVRQITANNSIIQDDSLLGGTY